MDSELPQFQSACTPYKPSFGKIREGIYAMLQYHVCTVATLQLEFLISPVHKIAVYESLDFVFEKTKLAIVS